MAERIRTLWGGALLATILRTLVSGIFLSAGILKLKDADGTLIAVYQYKLLSWEAAGIVATFLPFLEITAGVALWIPRVRLGASLLSVCLTLVFMAALASALARNLDVSCGCFGTTDLLTTSGVRLAEDAFLLLICGTLWRYEHSKHSSMLHSGEESGY